MERTTSLIIEREPWMTKEYYADIVYQYGIESSVVPCPEIGVLVIFLEHHDEQIFTLAQGPMNIIANLSLWLDTGSEEINITEHNYRDYDSSLFYKDRTGKYDIEPEI